MDSQNFTTKFLSSSIWRKDFPQINQKIRDKDLIYFDSAATTLKPISVINQLHDFNSQKIANVHRGAHFLSDQATEIYENARSSVAQFIQANSSEEIIFVRGTTEGINLISHCLGKKLNPGDEIILSELEHHSNIVPWQILAEEKMLTIKVIPIDSNGNLDFKKFKSLISPRVKILSLTHCSNHIGMIVDIKSFIEEAKKFQIFTVIDGAQMVGKAPISVKELDCDFYCFSGHKMFAPFGIGVVFGKKEILMNLAPFQGGGGMISSVKFEKSLFLDPPHRFEAGTPNVEGAMGLFSAIEYLNQFPWKEIQSYEEGLTKYLISELKQIDDIELLFCDLQFRNIPIVAFNLIQIHPSDIGQLLDQEGIAIRVGHHCTQPLLQKLNLKNGSCRVSLSLYNEIREIDFFIKALKKVRGLLV